MKTVLSYLNHCLRAEPWLAISVFLIALLSSTVATLVPIELGNIIDKIRVDDPSTLESLKVLCFLILIYCVSSPISSFFANKFTQKCVFDSSIEWTTTLLRKEFEFFDSRKTGESVKIFDRAIISHEQLLNLFSVRLLPLALSFILAGSWVSIIGGLEIFCIIFLFPWFMELLQSSLYSSADLPLRRLIMLKMRLQVDSMK